jgi:hypothetical protein
MAASSVRHVLLWALSAVLITEEAFFLFKQQIKNNKEGLKRLTKVKKALAVVLVIIFLYEAWGSTTSAINFSVQQYYPVKAVTFLAKQHLQGNLFTTYNFAGFVLWKLPGQKDFIDGRMPSWRRSGNYPNESNYALKDYLKMMGNESFFKKMLKQYDIHYLLLSTPQNSKKKNIPFLTKLENYLEKIVGGNTNFSLDNVDLTKLGMKKIYSDKKFVIYQN